MYLSIFCGIYSLFTMILTMRMLKKITQGIKVEAEKINLKLRRNYTLLILHLIVLLTFSAFFVLLRFKFNLESAGYYKITSVLTIFRALTTLVLICLVFLVIDETNFVPNVF